MDRVQRITGLGQGGYQTIPKFKVVFDEQEAHRAMDQCKLRAGLRRTLQTWRDVTFSLF
jgi:hypothetical protein